MPINTVLSGQGDGQVFSQAQTDLHRYFQEDIKPLIHQAIELDEQEPISSGQLAEFAQLLEETPVKGKDERKTKRQKLKKGSTKSEG